MWPCAEVKLARKIQTEYESCGCSSVGGLNEGRQNGQNRCDQFDGLGTG